MLVTPPGPQDITGWVLAGGQGTRMGGVDKGLQVFQGQALAQRALERLQPQVKTVCINANRHLDAYRAWGCEVYPDQTAGFEGPLMGFLTGLEHCPTEWLMVVPCDCPFFPMDLVTRLAAACDKQQAQVVSLRAPEMNQSGEWVLRPQPVFAMLHRSLKANLQDYLKTGGRKIDGWTARQPMALVDFNLTSDATAFANINTLPELAALQTPPTEPKNQSGG